MKPIIKAAIIAITAILAINTGVRSQRLPLYEKNSPLELILEADVVALLTDKSEDPEYTEARLIQPLDGNKIAFFELKVKPRGNTRRLTGLCDVPPLKFNFKKSEIKNTIFHGQDKLKLVSQCRMDTEFQNYVMEEYLLYQTYELLTEESYKTRLVSIVIKDIKQQAEPIEMMGFLIEDDESLEKRIGAKKYDQYFYSQDSCMEESLDRLALFQFMIGNTDWYVNTRHNTDVFQQEEGNGLIPVPFDFDFSGVINTFYAKPSDEIPITDVKQRFFKGSCRTEEQMQQTLELFNEKKEEIFALYESFEYLPKHIKKKSLKYFTGFYKIINDPDSVKSYILGVCNSEYSLNTRSRKAPLNKAL